MYELVQSIIAETNKRFGIVPLKKGSYYIYFPPGKAHTHGYPVKIVDGQYMGLRGLSNHWTWQRVLANGSLHPQKACGYDNVKGRFRLISETEAVEMAKRLEGTTKN